MKDQRKVWHSFALYLISKRIFPA